MIESADPPIKVGDKLTGTDTEILVLDYDLEADMYTVDLFNCTGKLLRHNRAIPGDVILTGFKKTV